MISTLRPGGLATLILALMATVVPLPGFMAPFRPAWCAVALLYWALAAPHRFGLVIAVIMGLALDALTGTVLGQHAFALLVVVYLAQRFHLQLRVFPVSQLTLVVGLLFGVYEFLLFWVDGVVGVSVPPLMRWGPVVTSALAWLVAWWMLDGSRPAPTRV